MPRARPKRGRGKRFVLDCSVALAWFFADEADPYADSVAKSFKDGPRLSRGFFTSKSRTYSSSANGANAIIAPKPIRS